MSQKLSLNSLNRAELRDVISSLGEKAYRAEQVYRWLYFDKIGSIEEMSNLPKELRNSISEIAEITVINEITRVRSPKDGSIKMLFELCDGERVESVILKDKDRHTACISTQVGCRMGCAFCATAKVGFKRNLNAAEIISQIKHLEHIVTEEGLSPEPRLTNIVYMGMGEPLDNFANVYKSLEILMDEAGYGYSHRRVTLSTAGVTARIEDLFRLDTPVNLAVSINAPNQELRQKIMPVSSKYPLSGLVAALRKVPLQKRKRITVEYVLINGINDSPQQAMELVKLLKSVPVKINLIKYNGSGTEGYTAPDEKRILEFQKILMDNNMSAFIRKSLGSGILGACGQLSAGYKR